MKIGCLVPAVAGGPQQVQLWAGAIEAWNSPYNSDGIWTRFSDLLSEARSKFSLMKVSWKNTNHYIDSQVGFFVSEKKKKEKEREKKKASLFLFQIIISS